MTYFIHTYYPWQDKLIVQAHQFKYVVCDLFSSSGRRVLFWRNQLKLVFSIKPKSSILKHTLFWSSFSKTFSNIKIASIVKLPLTSTVEELLNNMKNAWKCLLYYCMIDFFLYLHLYSSISKINIISFS